MISDENTSSESEACSPNVPNNAPFANDATHKARHNKGRGLFHGVDATLVMDLTAEAEQMAADRDRQFEVAYVYVIEALGLKLYKIGREGSRSTLRCRPSIRSSIQSSGARRCIVFPAQRCARISRKSSRAGIA
jgi:hypothetical protein